MSDGEADGKTPWQAAGAVDLVAYPLDALRGWRVEFECANDGEVRDGSTWVARKVVVIYVKRDWTVEKTANSLTHELGHAHDVVHLNPRKREKYRRARGLGWRERTLSVHWWPVAKEEPRKRQRVGREDFAEVFALRWGPPSEFLSSVRPAPSPTELGELQRFLTP